MEEHMRKKLSIVIVVVCLIIAAVVAYTQLKPEDPLEGIPEEQAVLLKCGQCGAEFTVAARDYHRHLKSKDPLRGTPAYICVECGEEAALFAYECQECGETFWKGAAGPGNFEDRCPACGFSAIEQARLRR